MASVASSLDSTSDRGLVSEDEEPGANFRWRIRVDDVDLRGLWPRELWCPGQAHMRSDWPRP